MSISDNFLHAIFKFIGEKISFGDAVLHTHIKNTLDEWFGDGA